MKAFFLAALMIACASAGNLTLVPTLALGIYNYSSTTCDDGGDCFEFLNVTSNGTGITIAAKNRNTSDCSNGATFLFEANDVQVTDLMMFSTINFTVTFHYEDQTSDNDVMFDNDNSDQATTLSIFGDSVYPCASIFTQSAAYLMKVTIGAIIVAAVMLI